jgi:hypothetical protein
MTSIFQYVMANAQSLGIQELIFEHQIYSARGGLHRYAPSDHFDHVHIGLLSAVTADQHPAPAARPTPETPPLLHGASSLSSYVPYVLIGLFLVFLVRR